MIVKKTEGSFHGERKVVLRFAIKARNCSGLTGCHPKDEEATKRFASCEPSGIFGSMSQPNGLLIVKAHVLQVNVRIA